METILLSDSMSDLKQAGEIIKSGGIAAIPTETVYGLAANALNPDAVSKIFAAKGRPQDNPLIVHIADLEALTPDIAQLSGDALRLAGAFWPGPLTMILPKGTALPDITTSGLDSVGIRFPSHQAAREIIRAAGVPVAAPSANISGSPSPTTAKHCVNDLWGRVDAIVDGGPCSVGVESTVVLMTESTPLILRPGAVTAEEISRVTGKAVKVDSRVMEPMPEGERAVSPGMKYRHYAPKVSLTLVKGGFKSFGEYLLKAPEGSGALVFEGEDAYLSVSALTYGRRENPDEQAALIFDALRRVDEMGLKHIYVRAPEASGVGLAVYNRLLRAASFEVIELD